MPKTNWILIIIGVLSLLFISVILIGVITIFSDKSQIASSGNIALIPINGIITTGEDTISFEKSAVSSDIIKLIERAENDPDIVGLIFEIDSPGGSPVASDEIATSIKNLKKPKVAWVREVGASGAYWIASSTDYIVANKMSITGSIGVIASYLDFSQFIQRYNVSYERLVGGAYKDIGSPFKELREEERILLQEKIDKLHNYFVEEISKNRGIPKSKANKIASGIFYLGSEALELGLVDELGGKKEAISYIEKKVGVTTMVIEYKKEKSFLDVLGKFLNERFFYLGKGIGSGFFENRGFGTLRITS